MKTKPCLDIPLLYILLFTLLPTSEPSAAVPRRLHSPSAMPGQIIADPDNPSWLRYNGAGPVYIAGIGEPENLLYRGIRNPDGTRTGDQMKLINRMKGAGVNCVYVIGFLDARYGGDGTPDKDGTGNPFVDSDITGDIDEDILDQWDQWFTALEDNGIIIYFVLYDDLIDVLPNKKMNWDLDASGDLHPQDTKYIDAVVNRFKHHKKLIWCVNESANKNYPEIYVARWKKIAERIREMDKYQHPISIGLVTHTDPDRTANSSEARYADDPNFDQDLAQHIRPKSADEMHNIFLDYWKEAKGKYNVMLAQGWPIIHGEDARRKSWAVAMAGAYVMHAMGTRQKDRVWDMQRTPVSELQALGRVASFLESVDELTRMSPRDDLRNGQTKWVLADEGNAYVAYSYEAPENLGLKNLTPGVYRLRWLDCVSGQTVDQKRMRQKGGSSIWRKPTGFGTEVALYVRRLNDGGANPP